MHSALQTECNVVSNSTKIDDGLTLSQAVPFFGAAVSSSDFTPTDISVNSPYYRGPVERRVIPTGILVALALLLLIVFVLWYATLPRTV